MSTAAANGVFRRAAPLGALALHAGFGMLLAAAVFTAPRFINAGPYPYLAGPALFVAALCGIAILFGPTRYAVSVFVAYMAASHMHNSIFILPAAGVEWHPRELVLLALFAHLGIRFMKGDLRPVVSPMHFFVGMLGLAWVAMALTGLVRGNDTTNWIQESRFGFFLGAYAALVLLIQTKEDLFRCIRIIAVIAVLAALSSVFLFLYTYLTGNLITNVQNYLGEFVRRQIGPFLLQSARPNPHMYFEVGTAILVALFFSRDLSLRARIGILALLALFAAAIAITMMRTAFIATGLSLALLAFASLPRPARAPVFTAGIGLLLVAAVIFGALLKDQIEQAIPDLGVSLKARVEETGGGLEVFEEHPLAGGGLGKTFEAMGYVAKETRAAYGQATYLMVHNVWLYFLFKGGLIAFALALASMLAIALYGFYTADHLHNPIHAALARGLAAAFLAQAIASLAMPRFNYPTGLTFIALTATTFVVLARQKRT